MMFFYSFIAVMIPVILGALRTTRIGIDVGTYALPGYLRAMASSSFADFSPEGIFGKESGWNLVTYFSTKIFENINWNFFMYEIITIPCFYIGAWRYRKSAPLWLIMLYFLFQYNYTYTAMRNSIACSIIFMGLPTLEARHYWRFLLYIIAATFFHSSAIICIGYILILHQIITSEHFLERNKTLKNFLIYGSIGMLVLARPVMVWATNSIPLLSKYAMYMNATRETSAGFWGVGWARVLVNLGQAVLFIFYSKGAKRLFAAKWKGGLGMYEYLRYVLFFMIAFRFGVGFFDRMILYLEYVNILTLASVHNFVKEKHLKAAVLLAVIGASLLTFWHIYIHKGDLTSGTWPYRSILD